MQIVTASHLEVVDFVGLGGALALLQRGPTHKRGDLRVGKEFERLPEGGRWLLRPHSHAQCRRQDLLLVGLPLGLLHQGLLLLVHLVRLSGRHPGPALKVSQSRKEEDEWQWRGGKNE